MTFIILCLKTGGEYTHHHVRRIVDQCDLYAPGARIYCLTDDARFRGYKHCGRIALSDNWPGWWSKMEIFRIPGPCLYLDLDTVLFDDITPLLEHAQKAPFTILRDVNYPDRLQSSVMSWRGDWSWIYRKFREDDIRNMEENSSPAHWGDQGFLMRHLEDPVIWQDALPGMLVSWKKDCLQKFIPDDARVIFFHGKPRPWEVLNPLW